MDFNVDVAGLIANSIYDLNNVVSVGIVTDFNTTFDNFNGTYTLVALDTIVDSNIGVGAPANWANKDILNTSVITPIDHDVLSIASAYNVNVTTLFLFDTKSDNAIWLKDLYVTKEFAIQKITYTSSMVWYVLVDSISDGLILQIEDTNGNALTPSYTKVVDKNKIEINFSTAKAGNVYVLSGSQNEAVNTDFIITNDNVMNVLSSTDFFTKRFKRWIH